MTGRFIRTVARPALAVATTLFLLLALEGIARLTWREVEASPPRSMKRPGRQLSPTDTAAPNVKGLFKGAYFRTNALGLRGPDYPREPLRGVFRIAVAGDSVTVGAGVDEEDTYVGVLGRLLNQGADGRRYEVLNVGRGGFSARWVMQLLADAADTYRFNLAVYGWTPNDIEGPAYRKVKGSAGWDAYWSQVRRYERSPSYLLRVLGPRWMALRQRVWPTLGKRYREVRFNYFRNRRAWEDFASALDRFAQFVNERGICGQVFLHSREETLENVHDKVAAAALARGLTVTRSLPTFAGLRASDYWLSVYDPHPNTAGHALLAQALYEGLQANLPEHCWDAGTGRWPP